MRVISKWASQNIMTTRILVIHGFIILFLTSYSLGILLYDINYTLSLNIAYFAIIVFVGLQLIYPILQKRVQLNFRNRKIIHLLSILTVVIISMTSSNLLLTGNDINSGKKELSISSSAGDNRLSNKYANFIVLQSKKSEPQTLSKLKSSKFKLRIKSKLAKRIKKKLQKMKTNKSKNGVVGGQVLFSILLFAILIAELFGLAALICHLSCSGYAVWTAVSTLGGIGVIIFTLVFGIKGIIKWTKRKRSESVESSNISIA